jgi:hypothetical protein
MSKVGSQRKHRAARGAPGDQEASEERQHHHKGTSSRKRRRIEDDDEDGDDSHEHGDEETEDEDDDRVRGGYDDDGDDDDYYAPPPSSRVSITVQLSLLKTDKFLQRKPQGSNPASSDDEATSTAPQKKSSRRTADNQLTDELDEMQSTAAMSNPENRQFVDDFLQRVMELAQETVGGQAKFTGIELMQLAGYRIQAKVVMNPAGPSPSGLRFSMELEVDPASWMVTMVTLATMVTVLLVLGWLLAFR